MRSSAKILLSLFFLVMTIMATAQTPPSKTPGTISGRVTAGSDPAAGVEVMLKTSGNPAMDMLQTSPAVTATTDASGWYRITGIAPGNYRIVAYAPAHVIEGETNPLAPGKTVNVGEGENIENINFSITPGGVITGKITDPDNRAVIAEPVRAYKLDANGKRNSSGIPDFANMWQTDDRGVYRIFGLEPGKYIVAAGAASEDAILRMAGAGGAYYRRTFYPEAVEEAEAKIIEVTSGGEVESIDIKLVAASRSKTFAATGRVIEAETGKPVPGVMIGYGVTKGGGGSFGFGNSATNSAGEFRLEGLTPNTYNTFVIGLEASENYASQVNFEITGSDVSGLEIKMNRGSSISGVAVIEGSADPTLREKLTKVQIRAQTISSGDNPMGMEIDFGGGAGQIAANGTFKLGGIKPGKVRLSAMTFMAEKGFSLLRVEHNGAEVKELQLNAGDRLTGVRLVFAYGTASIAGRVEVRGGTLPAGARLFVRARREGGAEDPFSGGMPVQVDARGQFLIEGLSAGTYRLTLVDAMFGDDGQRTKLPKVEQTVSVAGSGRQDVLMVVDLSKEEK